MIHLIETVIVSTRLPPLEGEGLDRVRSTYVNDLSQPGKPFIVTEVIRHDPRAALPDLPEGLEPHEVPLTIGETRVKVMHMDRSNSPGRRQ